MNQPPSLTIPPSQNTAPVLEFSCLFTQDVRRKAQKRWQDGRLKFHTFNKRVMVYDERSNFIGDMHWQGDWDFGEGEDLRLERGGVEVQVCECIGKKEQDLTELLDKRVKDREDRIASKAASTMSIQPQGQFVRAQLPRPSGELPRPKALNSVIGPSTGHYGRAIVPNVSPFEKRQQSNRDENMSEIPARQHKRAESTITGGGYAQRLMGATLSLGSQKQLGTAIKYEPFRSSIQRSQTKSAEKSKSEEGICGADRHNIPEISQEDRPRRVQERKLHRSPPLRKTYASNLTGAVLSLAPPRNNVTSLDGVASKTTISTLVEATNHRRERRDDTSVESEFTTGKGVDSSNRMKHPSTRYAEVPNKRRKVSPATDSNSLDKRGSGESSSFRGLSPGTGVCLQSERPTTKLQIKCRPLRTLMTTNPNPRSTSNLSSPLNDSYGNVVKSKQAHPISTPSSLLQDVHANSSQSDSSHVALKTPSATNGRQDTLYVSSLTSPPLTGRRVITDKPTSTLRIKARPPRMMMMLMGRPVLSSHSPVQSESYESDKSRRHRQSHVPKTLEIQTNNSESIIECSLPIMDSKHPTAPPLDSGISHLTIDALLFPSQAAKEMSRLAPPKSKTQILVENGAQPQGSAPIAFAADQSEATSIMDKVASRIQVMKEVDNLPAFLDIRQEPAKPDKSADEDNRQLPKTVSANSAKPSKQINTTTLAICSTIKEIGRVPVPLSQQAQIDPLSSSSKAASQQLMKALLLAEEENDDLFSGSKAVTNFIQNVDIFNQSLDSDRPPQGKKTIGTTSAEREAPNILEVEQMTRNRPIITIANPATRGQSIQTTAKNTADMLNQSASLSYRDVPQPLTKTNVSRPRILAMGLTNNKPEATTTLGGGPWSRESFDLFGTWRPPRAAAMSSTDG